jgi:ATP-dependent Clp protease ATP-binding subunit ClpA
VINKRPFRSYKRTKSKLRRIRTNLRARLSTGLLEHRHSNKTKSSYKARFMKAKDKINFSKLPLQDFKEISARKMMKLLKSCRTHRLELLLSSRLLQAMTKKCVSESKPAMCL